MYCKKCGNEISEGINACNKCGDVQNASILSNKKGMMFYVSIAVALLNAIIPFCKWVKVPIAAGLYSLFGMSDESASFSLFGYILADNSNDDTVFAVIMVLALLAFIGVIFNVLYVIKSFKHNEKRYKYGTIASIIMIIMSVLFIVVVGLMALILKLIELTYVPYIAFIAAIANIVLVKKLKKN